MPATETSASYSPVAPITANISSILSQDVLTTNNIPVDSQSPSPVSPFVNPTSTLVEALGIVTPASASGPQLAHVARSAASEAGWVVNPLFGGISAQEVATGTAYGITYGFYIDASGIWSTQLDSDGVTWLAQQQVWSGNASNIGVAYSPAQKLVVYAFATDSSDLVVVTQEAVGGAWQGSVVTMGGLLSQQFSLVMQNNSNWWISSNDGGNLVVISGELGVSQYQGVNAISGFSGNLQQIVVGYYAQTQNTMMCFAIDNTNTLHVWSSANPAAPGGVLTPIAGKNNTVAGATAFVSTNGTISLYAIDTEQKLWVLHQDQNNPFLNGAPQFTQYIPLDRHIGGVVSDMNPADVPTLFALDASDFTLRLHAQDPSTLMWSSVKLLQASPAMYEYTRYRTEVSLVDANGVPVANYPVSLQVQENYSAADIWVAGSTYNVSSTAPVQLTTDSLGKVTMAMLPVNGLASPMFQVSAENLTAVSPFSPALPVHTYLSGNGTLYPTQPTDAGGPLPVFDPNGNTLAAAKSGQLAPIAAKDPDKAQTAAQAIIKTAQLGLGTPQSTFGFAADFERGTYREFETQEELLAALGTVQPDSFGSDLKNFFADLWQGIKNGLIELKNIIVNFADKALQLLVKIGDELVHIADMVIDGIEQAAQAIAGVFQAVAAEIEKVVDWLKALFDFKAIWRTKDAFQNLLVAAPGIISNFAAQADNAATGWFTQQQTAVQNYFQNWQNSYATGSFSQQPGWQAPGQPSTTPVSGGASPSDFTNNAHHNWLQNKVSSGSPNSLGIPSISGPQDAWSNFETQISNAGAELQAALSDFGDAIKSIIANGLGNAAMSDFVGAMGNLVAAALSLADGIVSALAALAEDGMDALSTLLSTPLDLGFLNTLWNWLAEKGGSPGDPFTVAGLVSLVAAFPTTIIYKLIEGVETEPFPPNGGSTFAVAGVVTTGEAAVLCGAILDVLYVIPQMASDVMGADTPQWLAIGLIGLTIVIWLLENAPGLDNAQWTTLAVAAASIVGFAPGVIVIVKSCAASFWESYVASGVAVNLALTLVGILQEVFGMIATMSASSSSTAAELAAFFSPLSNLFSFLALPVFEELLPLKMAMDFLAYVGGGIAQVEQAVAQMG